jgi:hypothetical protein
MKQAQLTYRYIITILIISSSIISLNCKKNPLTPPPSGPDTTSHNFIWHVDTLGNYLSNWINDVIIVNDTLAYAVGEIYMNEDPYAYGVAIWNGRKWELKRIYDTSDQLIFNFRGIICFSPTDIWLTDGGIHRWNGTSSKVSASFDRISLIGGEENFQSVNRLWGVSSNDIYGVGYKGMVTHYDGVTWQKIQSGITQHIQDVWGYKASSGSQPKILAICSDVFNGGNEYLLSINNSIANIISSKGLPWSLRGIWFTNNSYYIVGAGLYIKKDLEKDTAWINYPYVVGNNYMETIRGSAWNDIMVVGDFGTILHYNGATWHNYTNEINMHDAIFYGVSIKGNHIIAVGTLGGGPGIIVRGDR